MKVLKFTIVALIAISFVALPVLADGSRDLYGEVQDVPRRERRKEFCRSLEEPRRPGQDRDRRQGKDARLQGQALGRRHQGRRHLHQIAQEVITPARAGSKPGPPEFIPRADAGSPVHRDTHTDVRRTNVTSCRCHQRSCVFAQDRLQESQSEEAPNG